MMGGRGRPEQQHPVGHGDTVTHSHTPITLSLSLSRTEIEGDDMNGRGRQIAGFACLRKGVKRYSNPPLLHCMAACRSKRPFAWELMELVLAKCCVCLLGSWHMFFLLGPIHLSTHHADFFGFGLIWSVHKRWYVYVFIKAWSWLGFLSQCKKTFSLWTPCIHAYMGGAQQKHDFASGTS